MDITGNDQETNHLILLHVEIGSISEDINSIYHFYLDQNVVEMFRIRNGIGVPPPRGYKKVRVDSARHHAGQKHIHIYVDENNEYVSINQDGSRHHKKGEEIILPKELYKWIEKNFPDFNLPSDRIIRYGEMTSPPMIEPSLVIDIVGSEIFDHDYGIRWHIR